MATSKFKVEKFTGKNDFAYLEAQDESIVGSLRLRGDIEGVKNWQETKQAH